MHPTDTWRSHRFRSGEKYGVINDLHTQTSEFIAGEIVTFEKTAYSAYDSSTAFIFKSADGTLKTWFLHDDDPDNSAQLFYDL